LWRGANFDKVAGVVALWTFWDIGKEAFGQAILVCLKKNGLVGNLQYRVVVQEYHKNHACTRSQKARSTTCNPPFNE